MCIFHKWTKWSLHERKHWLKDRGHFSSDPKYVEIPLQRKSCLRCGFTKEKYFVTIQPGTN